MMTTNPTGYLRRYYKLKRNIVVQQLGGRCVKCFVTTNLHIHHKAPLETPSGRGSLARLTEWKKNIHNLMIYCEGHHKEIRQP